ncbi:related to methyltransferase involved in pre-rRNA cleavage [Cephalotrichum gorgonifer]|uniref:Ribosomal RNA-processing protein 8 n=1 Tax=Cephalotrichum gorgonifer TaxID=2041049 RepID=A0AAE8SYJ3_9PEZI|nr:related to methyltransferase involved in pre-rRNA cleavage [Cephalotrichum gorgonifer]
MFAVPGWSVASDALKPEKLADQKAGKTKKRKRPEAAAVSADNLGSMWEKVIEGKAPGAKGEEGGKKRKRGKGGSGKGAAAAAAAGDGKPQQEHKAPEQQPGEEVEGEPAAAPKKKKSRKEKKLENKKAAEANDSEAQPATASSPGREENAPKPAPEKKLPAAPVPAPAPAKLTPLQAAMRAKLVPARFRHLNETLYTRPSAEAFKLFHDSPEMFDEYHAGFRQQVGVWPENPVDGYIEAIRQRGADGGHLRPPRDNNKRRGKGAKNQQQDEPPAQAEGGSAVASLPRTLGICTVADLGCGDARLASELAKDKDKLRVKILSYDLQSPHPLVTRADIANLPAADGSVNVAVFCLALMGTNWLDFIEEAYRILHWKGELWVAEIKSRFGRRRQPNAPVPHSVGNRKKKAGAAANAKGGPDPDFSKDLAIEVDGQEDRRNETDVSAFVDALRKRGFVLRGEGTSAVEDSVDLGNKMFVKMWFVKGTAPTVGKWAAPQGAKGGRGPEEPDRFGRIGMKSRDEEVEEIDENTILKPCVYKQR